MSELEDLTRGAAACGILPDCLATVIYVRAHGSSAVQIAYQDAGGRPNAAPPYRNGQSTLKFRETDRPRGFDGDGNVFHTAAVAPLQAITVESARGTGVRRAGRSVSESRPVSNIGLFRVAPGGADGSNEGSVRWPEAARC
jgi:hypothetical protein